MSTPFSATTRSLQHDSARLSYAVWLFSLLLLLCWLVWFFGVQVVVYKASQRARIEVKQAAHSVSNQRPGSVKQIALTIGDKVQQGQLLMQLDDKAAQLQLNEELAKQQSIPWQLQTLQQEINSQRQEIQQVKAMSQAEIKAIKATEQETSQHTQLQHDKLKRLTGLHEKGFLSEIDWQKTQKELFALQHSLNSATHEVERVSWQGKSRLSEAHLKLATLEKEHLQLQAQLQISQASSQRLQQEIAQHQVLAPINGQIGELNNHIKVGSYLQAGEIIAQIIPDDEMKITAYFNPVYAQGQLKEGQNARFRLDAYSWTQYGSIQASVTHVGQETLQGLQQVDLALSGKNALIPLQHGMTGLVEIAVEQASPAQLVLRSLGRLLSQQAKSSENTHVQF